MEWALAILFVTAICLLIFSLYKMKQTAVNEQKEIDGIYFSMLKENDALKNQMRNLELDIEVIAGQSLDMSSSNRILLRELLDLYKRGYTFEGIAAEKQMDENEVKQLLAPFSVSRTERSTVANEL